jgi:hypothetical protein
MSTNLKISHQLHGLQLPHLSIKSLYMAFLYKSDIIRYRYYKTAMVTGINMVDIVYVFDIVSGRFDNVNAKNYSAKAFMF